MYGQGIDTDVVEDVGVDGVWPGNGAGVDRTIYQEISGNLAPEKSNFVIITLFFRRKEIMIISTQEYGDLAGVRGDRGPCLQSPLSRSREWETIFAVQIFFNSR